MAWFLTRKLCRVVKIIVSFVAVLLLLGAFNQFVEWNKQQPSAKPFIYLTQTEQCLPSNLNLTDQIGDSSSCQCDVIVLSFVKKCTEKAPPHVTYLFDPRTSWASGRNLLFSTAKSRNRRYHYFILLDDDVVLKFNSFAPCTLRDLSPFRVLESWLVEYEPAVGVLDYLAHNGAKVVLQRRKRLCNIEETSLTIPTVFFDGIFNAFHRNAVDYILPYPTRYDNITWYGPQRYIASAAELMFRGQAFLFTPLTAQNTQHRSYPKNQSYGHELWREFIDRIQQRAPADYKNNALFERYKRDPNGYVENSQTYCMEVKRHAPMVPYAHFELEQTRPARQQETNNAPENCKLKTLILSLVLILTVLLFHRS